MLGEAVELVLGCSSCAWDEPGREAAPWALPCRPPTMLPAGRGATGEVSRPTSLPRAGARPLCRGREQESWPAGLISSGEGELELWRSEGAA